MPTTLSPHTRTRERRRATFCSSASRYFCSKRLHLLTKLLCSVKMEAAVAILSGVLLSLPLLPIVLISSSSLLMLSALPEHVLVSAQGKSSLPALSKLFLGSSAGRAGVVCNGAWSNRCVEGGSIPLNELQVRCEVDDGGGSSVHTLSLQTEAKDRKIKVINQLKQNCIESVHMGFPV